MDEIKVRTNNHPRDIIYTFELDLYGFNVDKVREEYDWMDEDEFDGADWFVYKGELYSLSDFIRVHHNPWIGSAPDWLKAWHGYHSFGFFGGLVIRFPLDEDTEHIIVGRY